MELRKVNEELIKDAEEVRNILEQLPALAKEYAAAERDYQVARSRATLELKDKGQSATLIPDVVRGLPDVSELRFYRDIAKNNYISAQKALGARQSLMSSWQSILRYSEEV